MKLEFTRKQVLGLSDEPILVAHELRLDWLTLEAEVRRLRARVRKLRRQLDNAIGSAI